MSRIGERMSVTAPRYLKMPAAGAGIWGDAKFLDAGTAHHLDSNLSHLAHESVRHLVTSNGAGFLEEEQNGTWDSTPSASNQSYDDVPYVDPTLVGFSPTRAVDLVAWDYRTSMDFGPFHAIQDRPLANGGYGLRKVRVCVETITASGASLFLVAGLTASRAPPSEGALGMATAAGTVDVVAAVPDNVTQIHVLDLEVPDELSANAVWTSRASGTRGPVTVPVAEFYVWIGYYRAAGASAQVQAVTVFETR